MCCTASGFFTCSPFSRLAFLIALDWILALPICGVLWHRRLGGRVLAVLLFSFCGGCGWRAHICAMCGARFGAVFTGILLYIRFPHFPIHPIGFTISSSGVLRSSLFSIFFSWVIKTLVLKFGGLEYYRKIAPFFLGMLAGQIAGIALGVVVDALFFPGNGHKLNRW